MHAQTHTNTHTHTHTQKHIFTLPSNTHLQEAGDLSQDIVILHGRTLTLAHKAQIAQMHARGQDREDRVQLHRGETDDAQGGEQLVEHLLVVAPHVAAEDAGDDVCERGRGVEKGKVRRETLTETLRVCVVVCVLSVCLSVYLSIYNECVSMSEDEDG